MAFEKMGPAKSTIPFQSLNMKPASKEQAAHRNGYRVSTFMCSDETSTNSTRLVGTSCLLSLAAAIKVVSLLDPVEDDDVSSPDSWNGPIYRMNQSYFWGGRRAIFIPGEGRKVSSAYYWLYPSDNNTCRRHRRHRPSFDAHNKTTETNSAMIDYGDRHKRQKKAPISVSTRNESRLGRNYLSTRKIKVQKQTPQ
jgi:hypothetical protein